MPTYTAKSLDDIALMLDDLASGAYARARLAHTMRELRETTRYADGLTEAARILRETELKP